MAAPFNPVIFVPGILGTELRDTYPVDPRTVFSSRTMMPLMDKLTEDYERIALHPDDRRYERVEPARVQEDRVISMIYEEFILELRHSLAKDPHLPVPVYPFPYDWRQPLEASEDRLEAFIDEVQNRTALMRHYAGSAWKKARKVNLVGHSMGGLMIAGLLARKPEVAKRIGKVATIGTPYQGSVEAIAKICMGTSTLGADGSSSREREAARMTPSLYYLLPSFKGAVEKDAVDLFDAGSWQLGVLETLKRYLNTYSVKFEGNATIVQARALLTEMLEPAEAHRKRIEAVGGVPGDLGADNWLAIAGIGAETRTSVGAGKTAEGNPFFDFPEPKKDGGDNTVPLAGAKPTFLDSKQLVAVSRSDFTFGEIGNRLLSSGIGLHASLPAMNLVQRLVVSMFQGDLEGNPGGRPMPGITREQWSPPHKLRIN